MKWTAVWSLVMMGAMITGCGGDSGGGGQASVEVVTAPSQAASVSNDSCTPLNSYLSELGRLTNIERAKHNAPALEFSLQLGQAAQKYAQKMAEDNRFDHVGINGSTFGQRIRAEGYSGAYIGENIAAGQRTPQQVVEGWMNSESHRNNLLSKAFTEVGFGFFENNSSSYSRYWVQNLGSGNSQQKGIYIPSNCGGMTPAVATDKAPKSAVAGLSNVSVSQMDGDQKTQPESVYTEESLMLPGNGTIPVGSLAFAVSDAVSGDGNQEIPEPALMLGLASLGLALWRDRKNAAKKAQALAEQASDE
ncbi:MAG: CAP domain-containing protein [Cyanobacteria bacterium J06634_6]